MGSVDEPCVIKLCYDVFGNSRVADQLVLETRPLADTDPSGLGKLRKGLAQCGDARPPPPHLSVSTEDLLSDGETAAGEIPHDGDRRGTLENCRVRAIGDLKAHVARLTSGGFRG